MLVRQPEPWPRQDVEVDTISVHSYHLVMRTIAAAKFKQRCLTLLDSVGPEGIVITKHGRPVARLVPFRSGNADLIGCLAGKIEVHGDLMSTGEVWDAES